MKVLVIGDVIIDKYIYGTSTRISPEAPVPVQPPGRYLPARGSGHQLARLTRSQHIIRA